VFQLFQMPPSTLGLFLPAFKRKRIEQWCLEVGQYLRAGSLCRSVIGHIIEDNRLNTSNTTTATNNDKTSNSMPKSAPASGANSNANSRTQTSGVAAAGGAGTTTIVAYSPGIIIQPVAANGAAVTIGTMTEPAPTSFKNAAPNSAESNKGGKGEGAVPVMPGRHTPLPDPTCPLPVVKFSYSHYSEQRRRIDRLVQGLPVLPPSTTADKPAQASNGVVIYVNGEEPVRERQSRSPTPGPTPGPPRSNSRTSSTEPRPPQQQRGQSSVNRSASRNRNNRNASPAPGNAKKTHSVKGSSSNANPLLSNNNSTNANNILSSEIVVIDDGLSFAHNGQGHQYGANSDLKHSNGNFRAPFNFNSRKFAASQKVVKARQRVLAGARASRDQNGMTPLVPVQKCWTMAELTW
jgi:hypothetical protein